MQRSQFLCIFYASSVATATASGSTAAADIRHNHNSSALPGSCLVKFLSHLQYLQSLQGTLTNFCPGTLFFTLHFLSIVCSLGGNFCSLVCHCCDKSTVSWWLVVLVDVLSGIQCKPYGLNVILFICLHLFCMARLSSMDNSSLHYHHCTTKTLLITIALHGPRDVESWNYA